MTDVADSVLDRDSIHLGLESVSKDDAVAAAGAALVERGVVRADYIDAMHRREETVSTYMANGVALPHGTFDAKEAVLGTGIVVMQYPDGVEWPNGTAHLVIGLAAQNDDHVHVLSNLAEVLQDEDLCAQLWTTGDREFVYDTLASEFEE